MALKLNNKEIINLYKKRVKFYKLSDFKVNCENKSKSEIIKQISKIIKKWKFYQLRQKVNNIIFI